jgi:hypothetical protein
MGMISFPPKAPVEPKVEEIKEEKKDIKPSPPKKQEK